MLRYHHTPPISTIYALRKSLNLLAKEGLENVVKRHAENALFFYNQLNKIGLELFVENKVIYNSYLIIIIYYLGVSFALFNSSKSAKWN